MSTVSSSDSRQASHTFRLVQVSLLVVRSIVAGRTISARCVSFSRLIIPSAAEESKQGSVVTHPSACLHKLQKVQQPTPASPLLSAIVDCFRLEAMIGYQPSLPRSHDAVPLKLNRSASPAQSESRYVNTESTGALFTASRLSLVGRTVMVPGFPRRYRRLDISHVCVACTSKA